MKFNDEGLITELSIPFKIDLIPKSNVTSRPQTKMIPQSLTIHNTGNPNADAEDNSEFVDNTTAYVSWTLTVGNNIVLQELPIYEVGWHAGDGKYGKGNTTSLGIEISEEDGAYETALKLIPELLEWFDWGVETHIKSHQVWSLKYCPRLILPIWHTEFIPKLKDNLKRLKQGGNMSERIDLKFVKDGTIIRDLEKATIEKLNGRLDLCNPYVDTIEDEKVYYAYCGYDIPKGEISDNVLLAQEALTKLGYDVNGLDKSYGNGLSGALIRFCSKHSISYIYKITKDVSNAINSDLKALEAPQEDLSVPDVIVPEDKEVLSNSLKLPSTTLSYKDSGVDVKDIQVIFKLIGYEIDVDGQYGNKCVTVLNNYRRLNGLPQTGEYDNKVREKLSRETISEKTVSYKYNNMYFVEVDKNNIHGEKKMTNGYSFAKSIIGEKLGYVNATFRWYNSTDKMVHSQSPFVADGVTLENRCIEGYGANTEYQWLGNPMPHFIMDKDGKISVEVTNNIQAREDVKFAVGGIKLSPVVDYVGFKTSHIGSLAYTTARTAIGSNPVTGRIILAYSPFMHINTFSKKLNEMGFKNLVGLDSGGSSQLDFGIKKRNTTRVMACWITFNM